MFALWREGRTGYPWIDAALRQLHREGWIHNYLRCVCDRERVELEPLKMFIQEH